MIKNILNYAYQAGITCLAAAALVTGCYSKTESPESKEQPANMEYKITHAHTCQKQPSTEPELTEAETYLKNFPETIPGAAKIQKYKTPGAKHCLVHIKQQHGNPVKLTKQEMKEIDAVQKSIYDILTFLVDNNYTKNVRIEGMLVIQEEKNKQEYNHLPSIEDQVKDNYQKTNGLEYFAGGSLKLSLENKITPKAADTIEAMMDWARHQNSNFYTFDNREDILLQIITDDNESSVPVVYGGAHAFGGKKSCGNEYDLENVVSEKDNIQEWNTKHPNNKFCLIEITPENYELPKIR